MTTAPSPAVLADLARAHGVATEYWDWQGRHVEVAPESIAAVLTALGVDVRDDDAARASLAARHVEYWHRRLPVFTIVRAGSEGAVAVHVPHGTPVEAWVELESGEHRGLPQRDVWVEPAEAAGTVMGEATFGIPADLPWGWHTVVVRDQSGEARGTLVVTPERLELPARVDQDGAFGLTAQLYTVRSQASWGLGDFGDLKELAAWSGSDLGADFVLINPVHAAEPQPPIEPSPYLPTSRRFVSPLYIDVTAIPEYAAMPDADRAQIAGLAARARTAGDPDRLDRDAIWPIKREALQLIWAAPRKHSRQVAYDAFRQRSGSGLVDFATWCVAVSQRGRDGTGRPVGLPRPDAEGVERFRDEHADAIDFECWMQWVLHEQSEAAQETALTAGMAIGVVQDLAVGVHPSGADVWAMPDVFAHGVSVGAPPDDYNQRGQDWSQPPWRPDRLEALAYAPFRDMVRAALRGSGGLRIDHIIGMFRLWWIPAGSSPDQGTYVRYDHEALIGILVLEAARASAVLIGEDLGTVEPWARDHLAARGILGTSILWFEKGPDGSPLAPEDYRRLCLSSVTTHDLPPTAGYLEGEHIRVRAELDLFTRPVDVEREADELERAAVIQQLRERGLIEGDLDVDAVVDGLHRFLSATPSVLLGVALADLVGDRRAINQPGTYREYLNWSLPLAGPDRQPVGLEDVMASAAPARLAACLRRGRRPL